MSIQHYVAANAHPVRPDEATHYLHLVTYADHVAALAEAEQRVFAFHPEWTMKGMCKPNCAACRRLTELITEWEYGYKQGLDAAREAVAAMNIDYMSYGAVVQQDEALAAIDALRERSHD